MEQIESLYLNTIADIREKLSRNDRYHVIKASGLLRHLFLDQTPLVHEINREYRLKIQFSVIDHDRLPAMDDEPPQPPIIHWRNLDPSHVNSEPEWMTLGVEQMQEIDGDFSKLDCPPYTNRLPIVVKRWFYPEKQEWEEITLPSNFLWLLQKNGIGVPISQLTLSKFLATRCLSFDRYDYTVKDIIKACAHYKGGVHSSHPADDKDLSVLDLDKAMSVTGMEASLTNLKGILWVGLNGLAPLEQAVLNGKNS